MWLRACVIAISVWTMQEDRPVVFTDDFEHGLDRWQIVGENTIRVKPSGDPTHGMVMELSPNGDAAAIIRRSAGWGRVRLEGEMLFPTDVDNYLGFLYNFTARGPRTDFGLIYVKGNDNYLQVNPHRDFNVSRLLYPEGRADLRGPSSVGVHTWHRFAIEVDGDEAHVYIGGTAVPQITFSGFEYERGALGLQPRSVGGAVWVDNVRVRSIDRLSYSGPSIPASPYDTGPLLTNWQVAGPFDRTDDRIARHPGRTRWTPFAADARGAVVTGRVVDYHGPNAVAYFRTTLESPAAGPAEVQFSTIDDLAVWLNGEFRAFVPRQDAAWFDMAVNPAHAGRRLPVMLKAGSNDLIVRVRGGVYASGGFYGRLAGRR